MRLKQTQLACEKQGGTSTNENSAAFETTQLPPKSPGASGRHQSFSDGSLRKEVGAIDDRAT